jgi:hypothetical protein
MVAGGWVVDCRGGLRERREEVNKLAAAVGVARSFEGRYATLLDEDRAPPVEIWNLMWVDIGM